MILVTLLFLAMTWLGLSHSPSPPAPGRADASKALGNHFLSTVVFRQPVLMPPAKPLTAPSPPPPNGPPTTTAPAPTAPPAPAPAATPPARAAIPGPFGGVLTAWARVAVGEEGGWIGYAGSAYPDSLGISSANWNAQGGGSDLSPANQIRVGQAIQAHAGAAGYVPDQNGCAAW